MIMSPASADQTWAKDSLPGGCHDRGLASEDSSREQPGSYDWLYGRGGDDGRHATGRLRRQGRSEIDFAANPYSIGCGANPYSVDRGDGIRDVHLHEPVH